MRPEGTGSNTDEELAAIAQTHLESADTLQVEPYVDAFDDVPLLANIPTAGSITEEETIDSIDAQRWTLSNGITVIAKQTDFQKTMRSCSPHLAPAVTRWSRTWTTCQRSTPTI